jgi:ubiquitin-conjugating enzyme E2 Q
MESVLLQIRLAMSSTDPRPAQLEHGMSRDYGIGEAIDAYVRACRVHNWTVPDGLTETAQGGASSSYGY